MEDRQQKILKAIVQSFISTGTPIGSLMIYENYDLDVSPATIRNDMADLEEQGLIWQPHTSAGRVPTTKGYRMVVDELSPSRELMARVKKDLKNAEHHFYLKKTREKVYDSVSILASVTKNVCFATIPEKDRFFYVGVGHVLRQSEFISKPEDAVKAVEVLENQLYDTLRKINMDESGVLLIGEENLIPQIRSCSLIAKPYTYHGFSGIMGILGSTRMDYMYNQAALQAIIELLNA